MRQDPAPSTAWELAVWALRGMVESGSTVEAIDQSKAGTAGPTGGGYKTQVWGGRIYVQEAGGVKMNRSFPLRDVVREIKSGATQITLIPEDLDG